MDDLTEALHMNNRGVKLLINGDDRAAVSVLGESLSVVKKFLALNGDRPSVRDRDGPCCLGWLSSFPTVVPLPNWRRSPEQNFICDNVVIFNTDAPWQEEEGMIQLYTACIILNLGITFHRRGVLDGNPQCMEKAEHFYGMICKLLQGISLHDSATAMFLMLASTNNLSQIHYVQNRLEQAWQGLEHLSTLVYTAEYASCLLFNEHEWDGLVRNLSLLRAPFAAAAA